MNPVEPRGNYPDTELVVYGKDQPQYRPLPASINKEGTALIEWEPTYEELRRLFCGGRVLLTLLYAVNQTTGVFQTPVKLEVLEPECGFQES